MATAIPPMEVAPDSSAKAPASAPPAPDKTLQGAYTPVERRRAVGGEEEVYCIRCGAQFAADTRFCPDCGYSTDEPAEGRLGRLAWRDIEPVRELFPILAAILFPLGAALFTFGLVISDGFHPRARSLVTLGVVFSSTGMLLDLAALALAIIWLFQAWRAILRVDDEYSPGLMVGMMFVPIFHFYWMFRAIPGLSSAVQQELKHLAPHRRNSAGWWPGFLGCVFLLIPFPPVWVISACMLLAWMLLANNAVQRLARYHKALQNDTREASSSH